jgi:hypothetical protein
MSDQGRLAQLIERYERAAHRVQTALAYMPDHQNMTPKHMRVGIDMSKADMGGLATLLIEKGLITKEEYILAITESAEREADAYESEISGRIGINVKTV